jgi:hypothetical protein
MNVTGRSTNILYIVKEVMADLAGLISTVVCRARHPDPWNNVTGKETKNNSGETGKMEHLLYYYFLRWRKTKDYLLISPLVQR